MDSFLPVGIISHLLTTVGSDPRMVLSFVGVLCHSIDLTYSSISEKHRSVVDL